jgi:hypothetical protein
MLSSLVLLLIGGVWSAAYEQEFVDAHKWMYVNEMTKYPTITQYQPDAWVTREQAAKFFVAFDRTVMGRDAETLMYCVYNDEATFDLTLAGSIQSACNRNLMLGSDGFFGAQNPLTKAQALTILIRSLQWTKEENVTPRWKNYFVAAQEAKLTKDVDVFALDRPLTRYELALLLWRVENPLTDTSVVTDEQDLADLYKILEELGLETQ